MKRLRRAEQLGAVVTGAVLYTAVRAAFVRRSHPREPSLTLPNRRWPRIAAESR